MIKNIHQIALQIGNYNISPPRGIPEGGVNTGQRVIQIGIQLFLLFGILITLFYLVQSGIQWITSRGDKQLLEQARLRLTYTVVGLVIMLLAFFIVNFVFGFFGINILK